jgi:hypothetical protein
MKKVVLYKAVVRNMSPHAVARRVFDDMTNQGIPVKMTEDGLNLNVTNGKIRWRTTGDLIIYKWFADGEEMPAEEIDGTGEGFTAPTTQE